MNATMIARSRWHITIVNCLFQRSTRAPTTGAKTVGRSVTSPTLLTSTPVVAAAAAAATSAIIAMLCNRSPSCATVCPMTSNVNGGRARTAPMLPAGGVATAADSSGMFTRDPVRLEDKPLVGISLYGFRHAPSHRFSEPNALRFVPTLGEQWRIELDEIAWTRPGIGRRECRDQRCSRRLGEHGRPHGKKSPTAGKRNLDRTTRIADRPICHHREDVVLAEDSIGAAEAILDVDQLHARCGTEGRKRFQDLGFEVLDHSVNGIPHRRHARRREFIRSEVGCCDYAAPTSRESSIDVLESTELEQRAHLLQRGARKPEQVDSGDREIPQRPSCETALLAWRLVGCDVPEVLLKRPAPLSKEIPCDCAARGGDCARKREGNDAKQAGRRANDRGIRYQRAAIDGG